LKKKGEGGEEKKYGGETRWMSYPGEKKRQGRKRGKPPPLIIQRKKKEGEIERGA